MARKQTYKVIVMWGGQEIEHYYDYAEWTPDNIQKILANIAVYEFDTENEAEAFREGMCAVVVPSARDFTELAPEGYAALIKASKTVKARKAA